MHSVFRAAQSPTPLCPGCAIRAPLPISQTVLPPSTNPPDICCHCPSSSDLPALQHSCSLKWLLDSKKYLYGFLICSAKFLSVIKIALLQGPGSPSHCWTVGKKSGCWWYFKAVNVCLGSNTSDLPTCSGCAAFPVCCVTRKAERSLTWFVKSECHFNRQQWMNGEGSQAHFPWESCGSHFLLTTPLLTNGDCGSALPENKHRGALPDDGARWKA